MALRNCRFAASLKAVGLLEPFKCDIIGVHIVGGGIFVFCHPESSNDVLCYQFEKQRPFDLMSLILLFGKLNGGGFKYHHTQSSEVSNCLYLYKRSGNSVWKIEIDDHTVTKFLSTDNYIYKLAVSSDGHLFILIHDYDRGPTLHMYAPDAKFIKTIAFTFLPWMPVVIHVVDEDVLVGSDYHISFAFRIRIWKMNGLKDVISDGNYIINDSRGSLKSSHFDITRKTLFVCVNTRRSRRQQESWKIVLAYQCLNRTSWCHRTLKNSRNCFYYVLLHESKGNLFIKPSAADLNLDVRLSASKKLMIYSVK